VVGDEVGGLREPPVAHLGEDGALARDAVGQDDVEGREPVRGDEQEGVAEIEDLADFSRGDAGEGQTVDGDDGLSRQGSFNFRKIHGRPFTPRRKADKGQADFSWYDPSPRRVSRQAAEDMPGI
jgi:hypothetical protein